MFGDFILWFRQFFKEQTCLHNYQDIFRKDIQGGTFEKCIKCGRLKK
jgi:hypothetical protein